MNEADIRFAERDKVFVMHMVEHGAAARIGRWWRTLPWRMRQLRFALHDKHDTNVILDINLSSRVVRHEGSPRPFSVARSFTIRRLSMSALVSNARSFDQSSLAPASVGSFPRRLHRRVLRCHVVPCSVWRLLDSFWAILFW